MRVKIDDYHELKRSKIFKHDNLNIFECEVKCPDGVIRMMTRRIITPFAIIIPELNTKHLVMVKQYRFGAERVSLEFSMGSIKRKTTRQMAEGELREETGYSAEKITQIGSVILNPAYTNQRADVFLATGLVTGKQNLEDNEFLKVMKVSSSEVKEKIKTKEIFDAATIVAFYHYQSYINGT